MQELALSAGLDILHTMSCNRTAPDIKMFIGQGKADELKNLINTLNADLVLFNHDLAPAQGRNLEALLCCRVIDRTELILDIFAQRARSFEGKLQVELAQLQHLSSCLIRGWTHLERQKGGIGLRGPGETQLETDRRLLNQRIKSIKKRLSKVASQRDQGRQARQKATTPTIALVGYTNAGKSTLFNRLTEADVYAEDQLFATLDPTLRRMALPTVGDVVLADTVGFVRDLPHDLIAAFRATLEEVCQADLLLHVVDVNNEDRPMLLDSVTAVIKELKANHIPMLMVYNKIDLTSCVTPRIDYVGEGEPSRVWLSAASGDGLDLLKQAITERLQHAQVRTTVTLQPEQGALRAQLYRLGAIQHESVDENGQIIVDIIISQASYDQLFNK